MVCELPFYKTVFLKILKERQAQIMTKKMLWRGFFVEMMPTPNLEYSKIIGVSQHRREEDKGIPAKGMKG